MSIQTTSKTKQAYILNFNDSFTLPVNLIKNIKNDYLRDLITLNSRISSGNIYCSDYNAWIQFYPQSEGKNNIRVFNHYTSNTENFYINRHSIQIKINKEFFNRHGFPDKEDENEA